MKLGITEYALAVLKGDRIACKSVKKTCLNHIKDLTSSADPNFPYYFDNIEAYRVINFCSKLKFPDGEMAGQYVQLADFQIFIIGCIFGWKKKEDNKRRYNKVYVQLARKQAKTFLMSAIILYMAEFCGWQNAETFICATASKQSKKSFKNVLSFVKSNKNLKKRVKSINNKDMVLEFKSGSTIQALSGNTDNIDGFMPWCAVIDEYHAHKNNQMVKLMQDGQVNMKESLLFIITTAGFNLSGACKEEYDYCKKLLDEKIKQDNYFCFISELDEEDDIWDSSIYYKSNPLAYYLPNILDKLKEFAQEVKYKNAEEVLNFKTKSLNKWVHNTKLKYINPNNLERIANSLSIHDFENEDVVIGLDLSGGGDLVSVGIVPKYEIDGKEMFFLHQHSFMPRERLQQHITGDDVPYNIYVEKGNLTLTDDENYVDFDFVVDYIQDIVQRLNLNVRAITFDPNKAKELANKLSKLGYDCIAVTQSARLLNEATLKLRKTIDEQQNNYNADDELLKMCLLNAIIVKQDGYIKIDKRVRKERIDIVDAFITCFKYYVNIAENENIDSFQSLSNDYLDDLYN